MADSGICKAIKLLGCVIKVYLKMNSRHGYFYIVPLIQLSMDLCIYPTLSISVEAGNHSGRHCYYSDLH